jgi:hypothetical protein
MSYTATEDWSTLPAALLPIAKQHLRVEGTDEDALITQYLGIVIAYLQAFWELQVIPAEGIWLPADVSSSRLQCPAQPVSAFTVTSDAVDVTSEYALKTVGTATWLVHSDGTPFPADAEVTLTVGYADVAAMDPKITGNILRKTAELYEHRESITTETLVQMPSWLNDMMSGLWVPRA